MEMKRPLGSWPWFAVAYVGGLFSILLGERVLCTMTWARWLFTGTGLAMIAVYAAVRLIGASGADGERRSAYRTLGIAAAVAVLAVLLELSGTDAGERLIGVANWATKARDRFEAIATVAWLSLLTLATLPILFAESALFQMRHSTRIEGRRVFTARISALVLALAAVYGCLFTYAAGELDIKADFSYFRTSKPSESTRKLAGSLSEPVKVTAFFPLISDVGHEVGEYLRDLGRASPKLTVEIHDRLLVPGLAKEEKVSQDGTIIVAQGPHRETMIIGTAMKDARGKLRTLDADFQKVLLRTSRAKRTFYITVGHGELSETPNAPDGRAVGALKKLLEQQNFSVSDLGLAQGLGNDVPKDAAVVAIIGPTREFMFGEVESLKRYAQGGGHLLLALEPNNTLDIDRIAALAGLAFEPTVLANDKVFVTRRYSLSDRALLITNRYSSHASVSTLSRYASRAPSIFPVAGSLERRKDADPAFKIDFAVKTMPGTFADANGDFRLEDGEKVAQFNLAAAVSRQAEKPADKDANKSGADKGPAEMRAFVIADADALSDAVLGNEPNTVLALDAVRWLAGEESITGAISTTEDVKIMHTRQKDLVWFYATIGGVPSIVLAAGLWYSKRRRSKPAVQPASAKEVA
jgi:hypothetical protein